MTRLRAIIVDWSGTIVDHGSCAPAEAFLELFRRRGVALGPGEVRADMGLGKRDHIRKLVRSDAVATRWVARHGRPCTDDDVDAMFAELLPLQLEAIARHARLIPGAREAVAAFRQRGLLVGSTTGYSREMMPDLERCAEELALDAVVTASDVTEARPAPWMALEAARRMNAYPMRGIVKIGDTPADIDEGRNAGMWTIGVAATGNELALDEAAARELPEDERAGRLHAIRQHLRAAGAHQVVDSIAEVPGVLDEFDSQLTEGRRP